MLAGYARNFILLILLVAGCGPVREAKYLSMVQPTSTPAPILTTTTPRTTEIPTYEFPESIGPDKKFLFYLHGRILEDQDLPAISPEYGEYEYEAILEKLANYDFIVISEQRPKNTNSGKYAERVVGQIRRLLNAGVPAPNITVVGASKGASIAILASYYLNNEAVNFVLLGSCHPDTVAEFKQQGVSLSGNILSIYDFADEEYSGSCEELYRFSAGKGLARHDEIVLQVGTGHGILYHPLDEWILPIVKWANER